MLSGIYERIRAQPFRPGSDHVTQVRYRHRNLSTRRRTLKKGRFFSAGL
jgi:hypothetical protein